MSPTECRSTRRVPSPVFLVALTLLVGCEPKKYQVVTRVEPDGRIYREIVQPRDESLPPEAIGHRAAFPPSTQPADYVLTETWKRRWATCDETTTPTGAKEGPYFKATGTFDTAGKIPRSYELVAYPLMDRVSVDRIGHVYTDFVLFGLDAWDERITETVLLAEYVQTLDEVARRLLPIIQRTLDEEFGAEYDLTDLHAYLRETAVPALKDLALWQYQYVRQLEKSDLSPETVHQLKDILARTGFDLPLTTDGDAIDEEKAGPAFEQFPCDLLRQKIRSRTTGQLISAEEASALLDALGFKSSSSSQPAEESTSPPATQPPASTQSDEQETRQRISKIFHGLFRESYREDYDEVALVWCAKLGGASHGGPAGFIDSGDYPWPGRSFHFVLEAAGPIFETNGKLTTPHSTEWNFDLSELWPNGYVMHARTIRWKRDAERRLFGREVLTGIDQALQAHALIAKSEPLRKTLEEAVGQGSAGPIETLAASHDRDGRTEARTLLDLLTGPPTTQP